jgi:hypothetical protein
MSRSIERANGWFWNRVAGATWVSPDSLGIFRWVYGLYLLLCQAPHFAWLDRAPRAFFDPPLLGLAYLAGRFPPAPFFALLDAVCIASACLLTLGFRTRAFTALLLAGQLVGFSFQYCFGKIDHDNVLLLSVLVAMLFADWGRHHSVDAWSRGPEPAAGQPERGMALLGVLLAFGMLSAGLPKAMSWIDFNLRTSGFLWWYYPGRYSLGRDLLLAGVVPRTPPLILEAMDYVGPGLELLGFPALLWSRRAWRGWLLACCLFHLGNALVLDISFAGQAVCYLAFVDVSALPRPRWLGKAGLALVAGAGLGHFAMRVAGRGSALLFAGSGEARWSLYLSIPILLTVIALLARDLTRGGRARAVGHRRYFRRSALRASPGDPG